MDNNWISASKLVKNLDFYELINVIESSINELIEFYCIPENQLERVDEIILKLKEFRCKNK